MRPEGPTRIPVVELSPSEERLVKQINFEPDQVELMGRYEDVVRQSCAAAGELVKSLLDRGAIPKIRRDYFTEAQYNIGHHCSRLETFERNGTSGDEVFTHPHFLPYLRYFIYGADLPIMTSQGFRRIVEEDRGSSGMVLDELGRFARKEIRDRRLNPADAAEEFFKLALDLGLDPGTARAVRDSARQAKRSH